MNAEPESFLARWSRRKRAAEREPVRPADNAAPELPTPSAKVGGQAVAGDAPVTASAVVRHPAPTTEVPLPPIESLDGLRSDYLAFFQQPVDDELRHAALKKLFADPHFNQMDMLDVYVDDYTQFEPLPAALRMRLPSARDFLSDSERAALEAAEASTGAAGDEPKAVAAAVGGETESAASPDAGGERHSLTADHADVGSTSAPTAARSAAPENAASANDRAELTVESPTPTIALGKADATDSSST